MTDSSTDQSESTVQVPRTSGLLAVNELDDIREAARVYCDLGWPVVLMHGIDPSGACTCGKGAACSSPGKHPVQSNWKDFATSDFTSLCEQMDRFQFDASQCNLGIAMGGDSRNLCLDIDNQEGGRTMAELEDELGPLPVTLLGFSGSSYGEHQFFVVAPPMDPRLIGTRTHVFGPGSAVDTRGASSSSMVGGIVVVAPSKHAGGHRYRWSNEGPIAALPHAWYERLIARKGGRGGDATAVDFPTPLPGIDWSLPRIKRAEAYLNKLPPAVSGQGGSAATFKAALHMKGFDLSPVEALSVLERHYNPRCQPPWTSTELQHKVRDAFASNQVATGFHNAANVSTSSENLTDLGNAERLARLHRNDIRWCAKTKTWMIWDGRRWKPDELGAIQNKAVDAIKGLYKEASESDDKDSRMKLGSHARRSESLKSINAMIALSRNIPGIAVLESEFDRDPWLLSVRNGVVDLKTGTLLPHNRDLLITRSAPVDYDPQATAPRWDQFLREVQPDAEVRAVLQRLIGYAATGVLQEDVFVMNYGPAGANGKSTFMKAVMRVLGQYARTIPVDLLVAHRNQPHPTGITTLHGCRLAAASETPQGGSLDVALVKSLTGRDRITARRIGENYWEFEPTHKLFLSTNHRPRIKETRNPIWRRVILIPWEQTFDKNPDLTLDETLAGESSGILKWVIEGCLEWQKLGVAPPDAVLAANAAYRESEDTLAQFLAEACVVSDAAQVSRSGLRSAYEKFCVREGFPAMSSKALTEALRERGFKELSSVRDRGAPYPKRGWGGIGVRQLGFVPPHLRQIDTVDTESDPEPQEPADEPVEVETGVSMCLVPTGTATMIPLPVRLRKPAFRS